MPTLSDFLPDRTSDATDRSPPTRQKVWTVGETLHSAVDCVPAAPVRPGTPGRGHRCRRPDSCRPGWRLSPSGLIVGLADDTVGSYPVTSRSNDACSTSLPILTRWTVVPRPTITPANQTTPINTAVSYAVPNTCPNTPCTFTAVNLPGRADHQHEHRRHQRDAHDSRHRHRHRHRHRQRRGCGHGLLHLVRALPGHRVRQVHCPAERWLRVARAVRRGRHELAARQRRHARTAVEHHRARQQHRVLAQRRQRPERERGPADRRRGRRPVGGTERQRRRRAVSGSDDRSRTGLAVVGLPPGPWRQRQHQRQH